jgi:hypothetical protein
MRTMNADTGQARQDLVDRAQVFATRAHQRIDHRRKYTGQPYDAHLRAVADLVATVSDDAEMLAAAWLHDIVEDTPVTLEAVEREFGPGVAGLVRELTDVSRPGDGNRAARKAIDRAHLTAASPRAKTVKLADLCDNARDICGADAKFARVFLREMAALLDVLGEGDGRMLARARRVHAECTARLGALADAAVHALPDPTREQAEQQRAVWRQMNTFSVRDLARPLLSLDAGQPAAAASAIMAAHGTSVLGLRRDGQVRGYVRREDLPEGGSCDPVLRPIAADQVLDGTAPLGAMVHVLTHHEYAFVRVLGQVGGVLDREDLQKPIGRMWLFGMVTLMELMFSQRIRRLWPDDAWQALLSPGRLEKARLLQAERGRRGQAAELLECLQLSDKAEILVEDADLLAEMGFRSKRAAQANLKEMESLRNHLAHAQDVVSHHWHQIARMSRRFDEALMDAAVPGALAQPPGRPST